MFAIDILELRWLQGAPEETDLCAHGVVRIRAGRTGEQALQGEVSMSASALHLLRTVEEDHAPEEMAKLFPTDGFCWTEDGQGGICLCGCPNGGFDGRVTHGDGFVRIALEGLPEERVPLEAYRAEVFRFADAVEELYRLGKEKIIADPLDEAWYPLFWKEWRRRRDCQDTRRKET